MYIKYPYQRRLKFENIVILAASEAAFSKSMASCTLTLVSFCSARSVQTGRKLYTLYNTNLVTIRRRKLESKQSRMPPYDHDFPNHPPSKLPPAPPAPPLLASVSIHSRRNFLSFICSNRVTFVSSCGSDLLNDSNVGKELI